MKKNQIILISIGVLVLIGIISYFGYWLGRKSMEVKSEITALNSLESKVIRNWSATALGEVTKKSEGNISIEGDGETLTVLIVPKTVITKAILEGEKKSVQELGFEDIKIGDEVNIGLGVDQSANLWAVSIIVLPK